jgi:type I restriction enzyme S subunit
MTLPDKWVEQPLRALVTLNEKLKDIEDDAECGFVPMNLVPTRLMGRIAFEAKKWEECKKGYTQFRNGDVILAKITPCFENGKSAVVSGLPNGIGAGSTEYFVLRSRVLESRYLHAFLKTKKFMEDCTVHMSGSVGHKRVPKDYLLNYSFPLAPLNEQVRIANKLDSILAKVDAAQARLEKISILLKRFRQAVLSAATSGELTGEWRSNQAPEWATVCLKDVARGFNYGSSAKSQPEGKVPVLRMGNLQGGRLDWTNLVYTSDEDEIEKYLLEPGDVLFNRTNSPELVGKTSIYRGERKSIFAGYLIRIKGSDRLDSEFLNIQLNSPGARDYCWQVKTDGVSQSNINAKKIQAYEFELPPIEEQKEIVRRVESLFALADTVEKQYLDAKKRTDRLTQSLLAKAFRGELVPQDADDEPAEELLKRIKAEREQSSASKPKRKPSTRKQPSTKKTKAKKMKLADAPANYLFDLLTDLGGEAHAEVLWKKSKLGIDDFYAKLKQEVRAKRIADNGSRDPGQRKLAINKG